MVDDLRKHNPAGDHCFFECDVRLYFDIFTCVNNIIKAIWFIFLQASLMININNLCAAYTKPLHYLILSQGIASMSGRDESTEVCHVSLFPLCYKLTRLITFAPCRLFPLLCMKGLDRKLALHFYGRAMFIRSLLPVLTRTAEGTESSGPSPCVVMSVLSGGVHSATLFPNDLDLKSNYSIVNAANVAGFYNDLSE